MDAVELRGEYGRELLMLGNISRQAVADGRAAIDEEVEAKVPRLMKEGGYVPGLDDMVLPDMRFEHVRYCVDRVRRVPV
jgi:hypothetical protein